MTPRTTDKKDTHKVLVMKDTVVAFPELWMDVFVAGDQSEKNAFADMFIRARCKQVQNIDDADLVVFTGGADVNPIYYGEECHPTTHFSNTRDEEDIKIYDKCLKEGIPMFGVCRGAQFLHVMQGGKLYQDVDGHNGPHTMWDTKEKKIISKVSSVHHQMCIENIAGGMEILGDSPKARVRWKNLKDKVEGQVMDVEAYFYRDVCAFGVQGHPEYAGYFEFTKWCLDKLQELVVCNPDIEFVSRVRRMKADLVKERESVRKTVTQKGMN